MPGRPPRLHLPFARWPAADQSLWQRAMDAATTLSAMPPERGSRKPASLSINRHGGVSSASSRLRSLRPWSLTRQSGSPSSASGVFAAHLAATNTPRSVAIQIDALYKAARVMMPEHDWTWLKSVKARLYAAAPSHAPAGPVITSVQLLDLGQELMDESRPSPDTPIRMADAVRYRDGLMIALLAFIPLRRKNLAAIEIGRHLVQDGDGWFIIIPCTETKTSTPIEFAVPELLVSVSCHLSRCRSPTIAPAAMQCAVDKPEGRRSFLFRDLGGHYSAHGQTAWRPHCSP